MNSKVLNAIIAIVVIWGGMSCQSKDFQISEDGYQYKYVTKGTGETVKQGEVVMYNMTYMDENDSVLFQSTPAQPVMFPCDTAQWNQMGILYKAFAMIKEGDSILIKIPTKQLFDESFKAPVPPYLNAEGNITFCVGATAFLTQEQAQAEVENLRERQQEEMMANQEEQLATDIEIIEDYLKENNLTAQSTETGLRYVVDEAGIGAHPQMGDSVSVKYAGALMDGTEFDSGVYTFPIGGQVIRGWNEGIPLLKEGEKGTLYIPSSLGYGPRGSAPVIPPNAVLKFEVELLAIK